MKPLLKSSVHLVFLLLGLCLFLSFTLNAAEPTVEESLHFKQGIGYRHPDSLFDISMRFRMQNLAQYESSLGTREARHTTQVRRLRLRFGGWMLSENLRFNLQLSFSRNDMDWDNTSFPNIVRDATVIYRLFPALEFSFGQTKLPGNRQRVVSSGELQFVDRSIVNRAYNLDRDFSLQSKLRLGKPDSVIVQWLNALSGGGGRNTGARTASAFRAVTRVEVLPLGEFKKNGDYFEGDLAFEEQPKVSMASYVSRFNGINRSGGTILSSLTAGTTDRGFVTWGADIVAKYRGASVYVEYVRKTLNDWSPSRADFSESPSAYSPPLDGEGLNAQAGYLFTPQWEAVVRYSVVTPKTLSLSAFAFQQKQITSGLNLYLREHRVKVQADVSRNLFRNEGTSESTLGQWMGRFQVELGI